jgi:hypothetical protein
VVPGSDPAKPSIVWTSRGIWGYRPASPPPLQLGCGGAGYYDILTDATPTAFDATLINSVHAARTGGTSQAAANSTSVARFGEHSYNRTDLGLQTDPLVAQWAADLVTLSAYPRSSIDQVTMEPAVVSGPTVWTTVLQKMAAPITGLTNIVWENPNFDYEVSALVRMVGYTHRLTLDRWEIGWRTVAANLGGAAQTFHAGPHAYDRLDAGNILAA